MQLLRTWKERLDRDPRNWIAASMVGFAGFLMFWGLMADSSVAWVIGTFVALTTVVPLWYLRRKLIYIVPFAYVASIAVALFLTAVVTLLPVHFGDYSEGDTVYAADTNQNNIALRAKAMKQGIEAWIPSGDPLIVTGEPVEVNGTTWIPVRVPGMGLRGWVDERDIGN